MAEDAYTRFFSLYEFFGIFLPGSAIIASLIPFLPKNPSTGSDLALAAVFLVLVIIGSFMLGQISHAINRSRLVRGEIFPSHRENFEQELDKSGLKTQFIHTFEDKFNGIRICNARSKYRYVIVQSYIHSNEQGRSRNMQAENAFCEGMSTSLFLISVLYSAVFIIDIIPIKEIGWFSYTDSELIISSFSEGFLLLLILITISGSVIFHKEAIKFQNYMGEYLISDFFAQVNNENSRGNVNTGESDGKSSENN
ncbi:hypothetical protein [Haladaptatus caseinilyticus]|uniref:hypothetical protein n=1 Tax=Haladaptatus caseinilyticus TaxID=2993314 RepID=UPI00224AC30E|nr:hypothetical protein [Haladaptatus caseinilyticus]